MKTVAVVLTAMMAVVLFQSYQHDCHWRGVDRLAQWASCILDVRG